MRLPTSTRTSRLEPARRTGVTLGGAVTVLTLIAAAVLMAPPVDAAANAVGISYIANGGGNSLTEYAVGANGDTTPLSTISGSNTGLNDPWAVGRDASGTLYVANAVGYSITEYAAGTSGNV